MNEPAELLVAHDFEDLLVITALEIEHGAGEPRILQLLDFAVRDLDARLNESLTEVWRLRAGLEALAAMWEGAGGQILWAAATQVRALLVIPGRSDGR